MTAPLPRSVFLEIADALQAILQTPPIPNVGSARTFRDRQAPLIAELPFAINVRLDASDGTSGGITGSPNDWATDYAVECYARVPADQRANDVVDPLLVAVWERLAGASAQPALIALGVQDVLPNPQISWSTSDTNVPQAVATLTVRIIHRTRPGSLATAWA